MKTRIKSKDNCFANFGRLLLSLAGLLLLSVQSAPAEEIPVDSTTVTTPAIAPDGLVTKPSQEQTSERVKDVILSDATPLGEEQRLSPSIPMRHRDTLAVISGYPRTIYAKPASWTYSDPWWHGMWINTAVLTGAFVSTLFVLEILPENATAWNRADITSVPFYRRWFRNNFKRGPEWDHDNPIFNFVLHPYAGAAYFMSARTCGFNFWQSFLYSAIISTVGWEFGIEACMERPSYQDLVITPVIGSLMGEGFYRAKRLIVYNNYELLGSPVLGHIVAFLLDPVNEVVGALRGNCRNLGPGCLRSQPLIIPAPAGGISSSFGISLSATF